MTRKSKISIVLSVIASIGVIATPVIAVKESDKKEVIPDDATKWERFVGFVKNYKFTGLSLVLTEGCLVGAQVLDLQEIAALTGLAAFGYKKYEDLYNYMKENHPDILEEAVSSINNKNAQEFMETHKEETYDGRFRVYEPITEQVLYSKIEPEKLALECSNFINSGLLNDHIVSIFDYVDNLRKVSGDNRLKTRPWMHLGGWCLDDDCFNYNCSYSRDGFAVNVKAEPSEIPNGDDVIVVRSLNMFTSPVDFSDDVMNLYDI